MGKLLNIIWIEWMTLLTFIYSFLILTFQLQNQTMMMIFLLFSLVVGLITSSMYEKRKLFIGLSSLIMVPVIYFRSLESFIFFLIITLLLVLYVMNRDVNESLDMRRVIKTTYLYSGISAIILHTMSYSFDIPSQDSLKYTLPFVALFLMASILYSRLLRHLEAGLETWMIAKSNIRYLSLMAFIYLLFLSKGLNEFFYKLRNINDGFLAILLKPVNYLFRNYNFDLDQSEPLKQGFILEDKNGFSKEIPGNSGLYQQSPYTLDINVEAIIYMVAILLTTGLLVALIIISIQTRKNKKKESNLKIEEERAFIKNSKRPSLIHRVLKMGSKDPNIQFKLLYEGYMKKIHKLDFISQGETTLDIQKKAESLNMSESQGIRQLYCRVRYGGEKVTNDMVETMKMKINNSQKI